MISRLKNYYYRIAKSRAVKIAAAGLLIIVVVAVGGAFLARGKFADPGTRAQFLRDHPGVTKILPLYWKLRKITDVAYFSYFFKKDEVPIYELVIAENDLKKINDSLPKGFMNVVYTDKVFAPAEFRAGDKTYQVRVRYRGINAVHWNARKRSYLIKFDRDDLFKGMQELNFIIPDDRFFAVEHFNNYRAEKLDLKVPASGFANLKVNGQKNALYFTIEGWSDEMLEKWELPKGSVLYGNEFGGDWESLSGWDHMAGPKSSEAMALLSELLRLLYRAEDAEFYAKIFGIVDKDNFYAWQIHQELVNSTHQATDNHRFYFDKTSGKFFFVPWDVEIELLEEKDNFGYYGALAKRIFSNPVFLQGKNQRLADYVADEKNLEDDLDFYDRTFESFKTSLYKDRLKIYPNRFADNSYAAYRQQIVDIFNAIRRKLTAGNSAQGDSAVRVEDDFNLAYPVGKSDEIVAYLKGRYIDDQNFVKELGPNFSSTYGDEDFTDI